MKTLTKVLLSLALFLMPSLAFGQQNTLTQTTLVGDITNSATFLTLTSATGVVTSPNTYATNLFIDHELLTVTSINGTVAQVLRGQGGTTARAHKASTMVLLGRPNWFIAYDPTGACVLANVIATPIVNYKTGNQWLCSSVTLTFVPGFGNFTQDKAVTAAVASVAGTTTPSGPLFHITGTNAITAWGIPPGCAATVRSGCTFTVIPDAAFTTTATNNIATAVTAVANLAMIWTWDATNSKFVVIQSK